jgi:hypothetical protein
VMAYFRKESPMVSRRSRLMASFELDIVSAYRKRFFFIILLFGYKKSRNEDNK